MCARGAAGGWPLSLSLSLSLSLCFAFMQFTAHPSFGVPVLFIYLCTIHATEKARAKSSFEAVAPITEAIL